MNTLTVFLYLRNDPNNSLLDRAAYLHGKDRMLPLQGRDGLTLLSDNGIHYCPVKSQIDSTGCRARLYHFAHRSS